ncbi:MAG TPA: carboxylesterase family protein, partial [Longimicrobiaceae bacterium]|nr:carboxylesterase family protein [Longimicrobiaceae bacterium]
MLQAATSRVRAALLLLTMLCGGAAARGPALAAQQPCASFANGGKICGTYDTAQTLTKPVAQVYRGIRYATAARWQTPTLTPVPASAAVDTTFGAACAQGGYPLKPGLSEDCFFLNVWAPKNATGSSRLPVMVFIHGGAFVLGRGSSPIYNGAYLAQMDTVLVVTLNYRLGPFGFLTNNTANIPANLGLMDQQTAMQWVRRYVGAFGGDSSRVTIFGESAGAMSVGLHMFDIPSSDSLFKAAIMESNPMGVVYRDAGTAASDGSSFARQLCEMFHSTVYCLVSGQGWFKDNFASMPIDSILKTDSAYQVQKSRIELGGISQVLPWAPTVDGSFVMGQPMGGFARGRKVKPFIFGMNQDEGLLFASLAAPEINDTTYGLLVDRFFTTDAGKVTGQVNGGYPYKAPGHASIDGMSTSASALDMLLNDLIFDCGNLAA